MMNRVLLQTLPRDILWIRGVSAPDVTGGCQTLSAEPGRGCVTVIWFSETNVPGTLTVNLSAGGTQVMTSTPELRHELEYHPGEAMTGRSNAPLDASDSSHRPGSRTDYSYEVKHGTDTFTGQIHTVPDENVSRAFYCLRGLRNRTRINPAPALGGPCPATPATNAST
jgi:hypothetical protein